MALDYPLINGVAWDYADVEIVFDGTVRRGVKELKYNHSLEPVDAEDNNPVPYARTTGKYKREGSLQMELERWNAFIAELGDGYMQKEFDVSAVFGKRVGTLTNDLLRACRIKKEGVSLGGDGVIMADIDLHVMFIYRVGLSPVLGVNF